MADLADGVQPGLTWERIDQMSVTPLGTIHPLRRFSSGLSRTMPLQALKQSTERQKLRTTQPVSQRRRSGISSRHYSALEIYPTATSLGLEAGSSAPGRVAGEPKPCSGVEPDLSHEKVENWSSSAYANLPFRPDFTLFEPIEANDNPSHAETHHHNILDLKSRIDTSLSERLVHLIRDDPNAAEQLRSEIINNGINLPPNLQITSHCFDLLFRAQNISSYLEWLPLVAPCYLQQASSLDTRPPISISEVHLNHILKTIPLELSAISKFVGILVAKECYSKHLGFTLFRHLVRTQTPATAISTTEEICSMITNQPSSAELIQSAYDFLVVQLANQGHLAEAIRIFYTPPPQSDQTYGPGLASPYPLTYQALADQLMSRIKDDSPQSSQKWSRELDKLVSRWRVGHKPSLNAWLAKQSQCLQSLNLPPLTKRISQKYVRVFINAIDANPEVCHQISLEKLDHFTGYFRSLFDQNAHPKFVKAAQLANEIHQILPLRNSFKDLQESLQHYGAGQRDGTEEQIIKSYVLQPHVRLRDKQGQPINQTTRMCPKFLFETRSDIVFLWAHSWMIFYHRSGQPRRAIQVFLDYFIPVGCDVKLLNKVRWGPNGDGSPSRKRADEFRSSNNAPDGQKYRRLIHPTVGVLTVLYDAILAICPPKLFPIVLDSFLAQHFHQPSERSSATHHPPLQKRLDPNMGSFRPFVRACLKVKDVGAALRVLEAMHVHLDTAAGQDEGGWIDLLEWCAAHSAGPQPKVLDPTYQWGAQRKRKIRGWDGKMKEELVFLVLQKFFLLKCASGSVLPSSSPFRSEDHDHPQSCFLEKSETTLGIDVDSSGDLKIDNAIQGLKIFRTKNPFIESTLAFLGHVTSRSTTPLSGSICSFFPSLKLISKLKFGFYRAKNSKGLKIVDKLLTHYK